MDRHTRVGRAGRFSSDTGRCRAWIRHSDPAAPAVLVQQDEAGLIALALVPALLVGAGGDGAAGPAVALVGWSFPSAVVTHDPVAELSDGGSPCDAVTVTEWFESHGQVEQVDGGAYISQLASNTPSAANISPQIRPKKMVVRTG